MRKKYKCKMCGYKWKQEEITNKKVFENSIRKFVFEDVFCAKCNNRSIVRNNTIKMDLIIWSILSVFVIAVIMGFF